MKNFEYKLDEEEQGILNAFENNDLTPVKDSKKKIIHAKQIAINTISRKRKINISISEKDLLKIKKKAHSTGIPYQTLIRSVLHQYADEMISVQI